MSSMVAPSDGWVGLVVTHERSQPKARLEIRPGASVVGEDGPLGRVTQVIVSPGSGEARGLVVQMGILRRREEIVPRPEPLGRLAAPAADRLTARLFAGGLDRMLDAAAGRTTAS